jgi:hypothetical protein
MAMPARQPVAEHVVRAAVGVGPTLALAAAAHVDDVRVVRPDVIDVDAQLRADAGELVGEEDVAGGRELVEDLEAVVGREVEGQALLAAVRVLEQDVDVGAHDGEPAGREAPHGVAALDVLDLDDLGAPVGEQRGGRGDEGVLGDLEDPDALHDCGHCPSLSCDSMTKLSDAVHVDMAFL